MVPNSSIALACWWKCWWTWRTIRMRINRPKIAQMITTKIFRALKLEVQAQAPSELLAPLEEVRRNWGLRVVVTRRVGP